MLDLPEAGTAIAVSIDGNGRRVACDPYRGTIEAVLECAQNLACVGAEPLGLTNCLNFGNPEKPAVAWQLDRAVQGLADVCNALGIPVVGGNVSLYNETDRGPIYPTPVIGLVGELPDAGARRRARPARRATRSRSPGPFAPVARRARSWRSCAASSAWGWPASRSRRTAAAQAFVRAAVRSGRVSAAHDVSEGGIATALAEMAIAGGVGADVELDALVEARGCSGETALFGEGPGGFLLAGERARSSAGGGGRRVFFEIVGEAGGDRVALSAAEAEADVALADAARAWRSLGERVEGRHAWHAGAPNALRAAVSSAWTVAGRTSGSMTSPVGWTPGSTVDTDIRELRARCRSAISELRADRRTALIMSARRRIGSRSRVIASDSRASRRNVRRSRGLTTCAAS